MACDHCGTVTRALTVWTKEQKAGCPCLCHSNDEYWEEVKRTAKRKEQKKKGL